MNLVEKKLPRQTDLENRGKIIEVYASGAHSRGVSVASSATARTDLSFEEWRRRARARGNGDRELTLTLDLPRVGEEMKARELTGVGHGGDGRGAELNSCLERANLFFNDSTTT